MTVTAITNKAVFTGNGVTTSFPFTFKVNTEDHLAVYEYVIATGVTTLVPEANYTIVGTLPGTGSVTYNPGGVPLPATKRLVLLRTVPFTQDLDIHNQGGFHPDSIEDQLDLLSMQIQQLNSGIMRRNPADTGSLVDQIIAVDDSGYVVGTGETIEEFLADVAAAVASASAAAASAAASAGSAVASALSAHEADVSAGIANTSAANAAVSKTQAELAALAAGAPLYSAIPGDFTGVPSPFLLSTEAGVAVYTHDGATETLIGWLGKVSFGSVPELIASTTTLGPEDQVIEADGHRYQVAATGAVDHHLTTAGGAKLYVLPAKGRFEWEAFNPTFNDVADNSALLVVATDAAVNKQLHLTGRFAIRTTATITSKVDVVGGNCTIVDPDDLSPVIDFQADGSTIRDITFEGAETLVAFQADLPATDADLRPFVRFFEVDRPRAYNLSGSAKRCLVRFTDCTNGVATDTIHVGFLPDVDLVSGSPQTGSNYCQSVSINGGSHYNITNPRAENHGSVVTWGGDATNVTVRDATGEHLHDNGVYGSSGTDCLVEGGYITDVYGTGAKVRGSRNRVVSMNLIDCDIGVTLTGNGVVVDAVGANGYGNKVLGCVIVNSKTNAILTGGQDGFSQRDLEIANNHVEGHTGTTTNAPILIGAKAGAFVHDNIVRESAATYAIIVVGPTGEQCVGGRINDNRVSGALQAIRFVRVDNAQCHNNLVEDCSTTNVIEFDTCNRVLASGNAADDPTGRIDSATACTAVRFWQNYLTVAGAGIDLATATAEGNEVNPGINVGTVAPIRIGQRTIFSAEEYVATGTTSVADWKKTTP